jgi:DNA ligase (NAD+)
MEIENVTRRVKKLRLAKEAYFNNSSPVVEDAEYDMEEEILKRDDPENDFLKEIGEIPEDAVQLPVPMPSLKKVKPDEASFGRFIRRTKGPYVCSDKLDGISALWVPSTGKLYLRGDGTKGADVTAFRKLITGLVPSKDSNLVRGELLIKKADAVGSSNLRSIVNGALHRKDTSSASSIPIRFVAYQVLGTEMTRKQQFEWLQVNGYETPTWAYVQGLNQDDMAKYWNMRRSASIYELDGIVVGVEGKPALVEFGDSYPDDAVAFKMPLAEQCASTKVKVIHWTGTRLGILAPRIEIEPVAIGGAKIQFVTGHNAKYIQDEKLGPGAKVTIRRSGDVIPIVDFVEEGVEPQMPPKGTWTWDGVHARATKESSDTIIRKILHYMRSINVQHVGEASIRSLIEAGIDDIYELGVADRTDYQKILGPTIGSKLYDNLHSAEESASEEDIWRGCPVVPAGIGEKRWSALFAMYPDPEQWEGADKPDGWNEALWNDFQEALPEAMCWRKEHLARKAIVVKKPDSRANGGAGKEVKEVKGSVVLTGFRDKELVALMGTKGWTEASGVTKKVSVVVIPDSENPNTYESTKVAKARELKIPIMTRATFIATNLSK